MAKPFHSSNVSDITKGAASGGQSNVAKSSTVQIKTTQVSVPPNRYNQTGRKR